MTQHQQTGNRVIGKGEKSRYSIIETNSGQLQRNQRQINIDPPEQSSTSENVAQTPE